MGNRLRNRGDPAVREAAVRRLAALSAAARQLWGRMIAHGMICHPDDSFSLPLGERPASMATGLYQRTLMKWAALLPGQRWPHNSPTRPEMEQGAGRTAAVDFDADCTRLAQRIARILGTRPPVRPAASAFRQTNWGPMAAMGYLHADHHLRQFGV
jgi:hypothetical protein